jgi:hypothetical protein
VNGVPVYVNPDSMLLKNQMAQARLHDSFGLKKG